MKYSVLLAFLTTLLVTACAQKQSTPEAYVLDITTTTNVKAALFNTPTLTAHKVRVTTENQIVDLDGSVPSEEHIERAVQTALSVEHVQGVYESLDVKD